MIVIYSEIAFEKASAPHQVPIFQWLHEPCVKEFWDNSQEHKDDILIFINGRKEPSPYYGGIFNYWIGMIKGDPFCLLMTSEILPSQDILEIWRSHLSKSGKTLSIDFMIGNLKYQNQGLAAPTLRLFTQFFQKNVDPAVDTFFIDPAESNTKAKHVYEKAGFKNVGDFHRDCHEHKGVKHFLMVKTW